MKLSDEIMKKKQKDTERKNVSHGFWHKNQYLFNKKNIWNDRPKKTKWPSCILPKLVH